MNLGVTGKNGEDRVAAYLRQQGLTVLYRNFLCKKGEIDIIAETDEYIIFVEVKTRSANAIEKGRAFVDSFKQQRMLAAAREFMAKTLCEKTARFDVAEVTVKKENGREHYSLNYIKNAF